MPTGVHIRDARQQLLDAAERVLLRDGPAGLTSRAVTTEADVAKGVLHRHFTDFDDFLAELARERIARLAGHADDLRATAGTGTVAANLTHALVELFDPVAVAVVGLVLVRAELRARLRDTTAVDGIPVLAEAAAAVSAYLGDEREMGRIAVDADIDALALSLVGGAHLLHAGRTRATADAVDPVVRAVVADVVQRRLL